MHIEWGIFEGLAIFAACYLFALWGILRFTRYLQKRRDRRAAQGDMHQREDG